MATANQSSKRVKVMLKGKGCRVGNSTDINKEGFSYYEGVIVSDPIMSVDDNDYIYILVQVGDRLMRADVDYIYYLDTTE